MAPHSGTLAWKIPWAEEPGMLSTFAYTFGHLSVFSGEMSIQLLSIKKKIRWVVCFFSIDRKNLFICSRH